MKKNRDKIRQQIAIIESIKSKRRKTPKKRKFIYIAKSKVTSPRFFNRRSSFKTPNNRNVYSYKQNLIEKFIPSNLKFLTLNANSPFNLNSIEKKSYKSNGKIEIPDIFSIIDNTNESYETLRKIISALLLEKNNRVILDYHLCNKVDLSTQVLMDIILQDFFLFIKNCQQNNKQIIGVFPVTIGGSNINNKIDKLLFSVGSPAVLMKDQRKFDDIIPYPLCIHDTESSKDPIKKIESKDLDTTALVEYVLESLARMNKSLSPEKLDDLCTVIGEILINAEEHSTTRYRFSIGYFEEKKEGEKHYGIFRLVILNFGQTIYEKFKDPNCPNKAIVDKMRTLSDSYTKRNLLKWKTFEEESLWTLYALQEGVTSIPTTKYRKRGNGSIQFIESFFNIKESVEADNFSRLLILSGNTKVIFDGTYCIQEKEIDSQNFKVMTFNKTGNIEDKPDSNFVRYSDSYFPGTLISAKILLNDDDFKFETN